VSGVSTGSVLLASFTQGSATQSASSYCTLVDWSDGQTDLSTESNSPLSIVVTDQTIVGYSSHTYAASGTFHASVTLFTNGTECQASFTVVAVPPTAGSHGPADGVLCQPRTFTFTASDYWAGDAAGGYTYTINWGDGSAVQTVPAGANNSTIAVARAYTQTGSFAVSVTVTDQLGTPSAPVQRSITIGIAEIEVDPAGQARSPAWPSAGSPAQRTWCRRRPAAATTCR
jgi:hypothetical protein